MDILIYCLIVAALLPYLGKIPLAIAMHKAGGYDNRNPRLQQARLEGFGARALAAHQNAFESLIVFSAAIVTALATQTINPYVQVLAVLHCIARVFYLAFYLLDMDKLRSSVWFVGMLASLLILFECLGL